MRTAAGPHPLVGFLTGPTAAGKSAIALALAERHGWSLLSVDSRQVYRRLEIGTAKPTVEERRRVEHLLVDCVDPEEPFSAGTFRRLALEALDRAGAAGKRVLAVGGTGLYWEALSRGFHRLPSADPRVRAALEEIAAREGMAGLYRRLAEVDPETARRLSPNDRQRIVRALEIEEITGTPMSGILTGAREGETAEAPILHTPVVALTMARPALHRRIEKRCRAMIGAGLIDELRELLSSGLPPDAPGLRTVGYREFLPHLLADRPLADCVEEFIRNTRRYAKRQETWFRNRLPGRVEVVLSQEAETEAAVDQVQQLLRGAALPGGGPNPS